VVKIVEQSGPEV